MHLKTTNEEFLKAFLEDSNHLMIYEKHAKNLWNQMVYAISRIDLSDPITFLENGFHKKRENKIEIENVSMTAHIYDPNEKKEEDPIIYIYNSHQLENYSEESLKQYNITPNVMMASYMLEERLSRLGIPSIAEEGNVPELLRVNGWNYVDSYKASRFLLESAKEEYPSLKYFIDLHRDAVRKEASTVIKDGKSYAKVLFVVGTEYDGYEENLKLSKRINQKMEAHLNGISRGVMTHGGKGYNGIYNQDISPNAMLLECGGYENTVEEVLNTIEVFANVLKEWMEENE